MTRDILTLARSFRHEWPVLALGLIEVAAVMAFIGWRTLAGAAL